MVISPTFGAFGRVGRCQILLENEISIFKKLVSRRKHEVMLVFQKHNGPTPADDIPPQIITECGNLTLDFKQLGLWASPDSRTLVSKWNTKLALLWKEDFGPLGKSPVLLFLSTGKTPLTTTVAKFLDTSVRGALDALTPASVHSLWSSLKILNRFCLTILIRLRFSRLVVHLFLPHFFLPLNFLLTSLDTAFCEQPASLAINVCGLPSSGSGNLCRCFELICWLVCHHILICWESELVGFC